MTASARHLAQRLATCPAHPTVPLPSSGVCFACSLVIVPSKPRSMPAARRADDGLLVASVDARRERIARAAQKAAEYKRPKTIFPPPNHRELGRPPETLTHNGRTLTFTEWARELNMTETALYQRRRLGWTVADILSPRRKSIVQTIQVGDERMTVPEAARRAGVTSKAIRLRIAKGLTGADLLAPATRTGITRTNVERVVAFASKLGLAVVEKGADVIEIRRVG